MKAGEKPRAARRRQGEGEALSGVWGLRGRGVQLGRLTSERCDPGA